MPLIKDRLERKEIVMEKRLVLVKWYDARCYSGTYNYKAILEHRMALFESVGYLLSTDKTTTMIAAETNDEGEFRDITLIPTGSVVSITDLATSPAEDAMSTKEEIKEWAIAERKKLEGERDALKLIKPVDITGEQRLTYSSR